jgi:hypothetical protein
VSFLVVNGHVGGAAVDRWFLALPVGRSFDDELVGGGDERVDGGLGEQQVSHPGRHGVSRYADIVCGRETLGRPIGVADAQIAAICRTAEATLATRHTNDFSGTGTELINPWKLDRPGPA